MKFRNVLNKNLTYLIEKQNIKVSGLAKDFSINRNTISSYLSGKSVPTIDFLIKFAEKFQIPLDDLVKKDLSSPDYVAKPPAEYQARDKELIKREMKLTEKENELLKKEIELLQKANDTLHIMYNECEKTLKEQIKTIKLLKNQAGGLLQGKKVDK